MMTRDEYLAVLENAPATPNQRGAIMGHFERLRFHPRYDRAERLAICAALLDLDALGSITGLTMGQAGRLVNVLQRIRGRAELRDTVAAVADDGQGDDGPRSEYPDGEAVEVMTLAEAIGRVVIAAYLIFAEQRHSRGRGNIMPGLSEAEIAVLMTPGRPNRATLITCPVRVRRPG